MHRINDQRTLYRVRNRKTLVERAADMHLSCQITIHDIAAAGAAAQNQQNDERIR